MDICGFFNLFVIVVFSCGFCEGHLFKGDHIKRLHFLASNVLDGRKTIRIAHKGVLSVDTMTDAGNSYERGLFIRELSDGKELLKLVFDGPDSLLTCELLKDDPEALLKFLKHFLSKQSIHKTDLQPQNILEHLGRYGNFTWNDITEDYMKSHPEYLRMTDMHVLKTECKDFYKAQKQSMKEMKKRHGQKDPEGKNRQKRDGELIYPGTKWCGKGSASLNYDDLGNSRGADRCCRTHDFCPYYIESGTKKYGYYNYGISTMVHCRCDESFRTCLKFQNNPVADTLGDIFFNRLAAKCFVLKPVKVCVKKSFWGRCKEYSDGFKAEVLEPLEY